MKCPHCEKTLVTDMGKNSTTFSLSEYPYPYQRVSLGVKKNSPVEVVQSISKRICVHCSGIFFQEIRLGSDMGGDNKFYCQEYKGGQYKFRDFSKPVVKM